MNFPIEFKSDDSLLCHPSLSPRLDANIRSSNSTPCCRDSWPSQSATAACRQLSIHQIASSSSRKVSSGPCPYNADSSRRCIPGWARTRTAPNSPASQRTFGAAKLNFHLSGLGASGQRGHKRKLTFKAFRGTSAPSNSVCS